MVRRFKDDYHLVIAVGSSEQKNERENPFSGAERRVMLESYLRESGIKGVRVVTLNDGASESWAVDNLVRKCTPDVLFLSTEKNVLADLAERRVPVIRFRRRGTVSSTRIRDSIAAGNGIWKTWTGPSVVRWVEEFDGIRRIRRAYVTGGSARPRANAPGPR